MRLRIDISNVITGLDSLGRNVSSALNGTFHSSAADMESFAKQNRPWTDRTGNARRTLKGVCGNCKPDGSPSDVTFTVGIEGNMPYSPILELGYGGRYSILAPTVRHFAPDILLDFARAISNLK